MRDKLIELMKRGVYRNIAVCVDDWETEVEIDYNKVADHLLANGVIVPPCKVGDIVYEVSSNFPTGIRESKVIGLSIAQDGTFGVRTDYSYPITRDIGNMVFLSREDAEKALRGEKE